MKNILTSAAIAASLLVSSNFAVADSQGAENEYYKGQSIYSQHCTKGYFDHISKKRKVRDHEKWKCIKGSSR